MAKDWIGNRDSTFRTLGASNHCDHERQKEDYYATEPRATELLLQLEHFDGKILEPSCGEGLSSGSINFFLASLFSKLKPIIYHKSTNAVSNTF